MGATLCEKSILISNLHGNPIKAPLIEQEQTLFEARDEFISFSDKWNRLRSHAKTAIRELEMIDAIRVCRDL